MRGDALLTSTVSTSKKPNTTQPYSDGSWNGRKESILASIVEMTSIGLFRSMWSSNEASSGTTCAYIFIVVRGRDESNTGVEAEECLSSAWTLGLRSVAAASGSANQCREGDTLTSAMILDMASLVPRFNAGVMIRIWFSQQRPVPVTHDLGSGPTVSRAPTSEDAPGSRAMVRTVRL